MRPNAASRTAEYMAFYRALESARPWGKRLFTDPFATSFLRPSLWIFAMLSRVPYLAGTVARYADHRAPGARTSAIARTRLIDDIVSQSLREGAHQLVILGAGFDCRFYRLPGTHYATAFEVDYPATISAKLLRLRKLIGQLPANIRFVEIEFGRQSLAEALQQKTFDRGRPTVFIWEGVTNYLSAEAVDTVVRFVAGCGAGTQLVFTYVHRSALDGSGTFPDAAKIVQNVAALGEPWTFGFIPEGLSSYLRERGLQLDRDEGARQYRSAYFGKDAESMTGYDFYHVAVASVAVNTLAPPATNH